MFETTVVESKRTRIKAARIALLPVSLMLHTLLIFGAIVGAVMNITFPLNAPAQIDSYRPAMATPLPPPGPAPDPHPAQRVTAQPAAIARDMAPSTVPDRVVPAVPLPSSGVAVPGAVEGGVPYGDPGSVGVGDPNSVSIVAPPAEAPPMPVGGEVKAPVVVHRIPPVYPNLLRILRKEGIVVLQAVIDKHGDVRDVQVVNTTHEAFGASASAAVRQWRFKPGTYRGRPVDTLYILRVHFILDR